MEVIELREGTGDSPGRVRGIAVPWETVTHRTAHGAEMIRRGAFDLANAEVVANLAHERRAPLARYPGAGLQLEDTERGLEYEIELPDSAAGRDAAELIRRRVVRGASVEMYVREERRQAGTRVIQQAALTGIGLVPVPAYQMTTAELRQPSAALWLL